MNGRKHEGFDVIGLSARVSNDEPSGIAALWSQFYQSGQRERVPGAVGSNVYCVYHGYEGDHSAPFTMTIGYRVSDGAACPEGLSRVTIPPQTVAVFEVVGAQPGALISQWQAIWRSDLDRAFVADFDTHDAENQDRVTVSVGVKSL
ncbi:MAG: GyrI-like domain-containing protein [Rhizobiaceae bacterium]|nr:GyrI-like domain-containing protein [Rhizobiaceae bacterium]